MEDARLRHPPPTAADQSAMIECLAAALAPHGEIDFAYVHGSFAEGLAYHDIDVAVFLGQPPPRERFVDEAARLAAELTSAIALEVDVQVLNSAPLGFQHAVLQGLPILVRDDVRLADYIEQVSMEYMDYAELRRRHFREVLGR